MANGIKIGSLNIDSLKVGSGDCTVYLGDTLIYSGSTPPTHDYSQDYLTFRALGSGDVSWSGSTTSNTLSYSTDNGATWSSPSASFTVSVAAGDKVLWKGTAMPQEEEGIGRFSGATANFDVEGNAMSLLYGDNFVGQTSLRGKDFAFYNLFRGCATLQSVENLSLPATTLTTNCYNGMFNGCYNLTTAPELPATTLKSYCYSWMFIGCTSLTTAPELPATTLKSYCYYSMFDGCHNLSSITCLATDISASTCTRDWVRGVSSSGTFYKNPSMTNWTTGDNGIPSNWTIQDYQE